MSSQLDLCPTDRRRRGPDTIFRPRGRCWAGLAYRPLAVKGNLRPLCRLSERHLDRFVGGGAVQFFEPALGLLNKSKMRFERGVRSWRVSFSMCSAAN
jgi:hypothetical protein